MRTVSILLLGLWLLPGLATAQTRTSMLPLNLGNNYLMGASVDVHGDYAAMGTGNHALPLGSALSNTGATTAYVYKWNGTTWEEQQRLTNPRGASDNFGRAVAISSAWLAVGSSIGQRQYAGEVYLYRRTGNTWTFVQEIQASDARQDAEFGSALSLDGDRLAVGAYRGGAPNDRFVQTGSVYIFERDPATDTWSQKQKINAADWSTTSGSEFGRSVALEGERLLVGAPGAAYGFTLRNGAWAQDRKWSAAGTELGTSVAISGGHGIVGAPRSDSQRGAAFVYEWNGSWPASGQRLTAFDGASGDRFGGAVAIEGELAAVGAPLAESSDAGAVYLYRYTNGAWESVDAAKIRGSGSTTYLGAALALHSNRLVAGAPGDDSRGSNAGGAYAYVLIPAPVAFLNASDNTTQNVTLAWSNVVGEDGYRLYRDGNLFRTYGANVTTDTDTQGPDMAFRYEIASFSGLGESPRVADVGRTRANGRISGDVKAGNTGVPGVTVTAAPYRNSALRYTASTAYVRVPHRAALDVGEQLTVEAWIKPDAVTGRAAVYSTRLDNAPGSWQLEVGTGSGGAGRIAVSGINTWVIESPDNTLQAGQWAHIAYTRSGNVHRLYHNGLLVAEKTSAHAFTDNAADKLIGAGTGLAAQHHFKGELDEVRLWNSARTAAEITADKEGRLAGDEAGLKAYWRMDAGAGDIALDYTSGGSHGLLENSVDWANQGAPVALVARTNAQGAYSIREISYGGGTLYTVTPTLAGHGFDPARRENVELNSTTPTAAAVNFADTTTFVVSGRVTFAGTPCATVGVEIHVNGVKAGTAQADGTYSVPILNPGAAIIKPVFAGHTFSPAQRQFVVADNVSGVDFEDTQTYTLSGKVVGGDCNIALGTVNLDVTGGGGCLARQVQADAQGNYSLTLPALSDVTVEAKVPGNALIQFAARPVSLRDSSQVANFIYRSVPTITLNGFPEVAGQCGIAVLEQLQSYDFTISVSERYGAQTCPVEIGQVVVRNAIADAARPDTLQLSGGEASYTFEAGAPNIVGGGQFPYQKLIEVEVTTGGGPEAGPYGYRETLRRRAIVEGSRPRTATFATVTPEIPLVILRDPPGDKSFSFLNKQTSTCNTMGFSVLKGLGASVWAAVKLGTKFEAGLGFSTETSIWAELKGTLGMESSNTSQTEVETCYSTSTEFKTNDTDAVTGSDGDVFVGGAMNILYALTDVLDYDENACRVDLSQDVMFGNDGFATEYLYTEGFIRNNLIPRLTMLRDLPATPRDSVAFLDDQIKVWQQTLAINERLKDDARSQPALVNRSFDGGVGSFTYTATTTTSRRETVEFNLNLNAEVAAELGLEIGGSGLSGGVAVRTRLETGKTQTQATTQESTVGYTLGDDDVDDFFSVDVKADPVYGTTIFQLASGTSSCPWEPGSQPRDGVQLNSNVLARSGVSPDGSASFRLSLGNTSQSGEARSYLLQALPESNPDGAVLAINGFALSSLGPITVPANGSVDQTLTVRRGPEAFTYENLRFVLRSPCDASIADTLALTVHFQNTCSPITLAAPEAGWVVNRASGNVVQVVARDYVKSALDQVRLQYAPAGTSNWQTARLVASADLGETQTLIEWNTAGVAEGAYELRVAVQCAAGTSYSPRIAGVIDRTPPALFGTPEPADGVWRAGQTIKAVFAEALDPTTLTAANVGLVNSRTGAAVPVTFQYADRVLVLAPGLPDADLQGASLMVTLRNLADLRGNTMAQPITWSFTALRSPFSWDRGTLAAGMTEGALAPLTATLVNAGGQAGTFTVTRHPSWLTPSPLSGTLGVGDARAVTFTPSASLARGTYRDTVVATTPAGPARLALDLQVLCTAPQWAVRPNDYSFAMNVTAGFYLGDASVGDAHDRVAAFVDGQVRGVAPLQRLLPGSDHVAYLTVYSNRYSGDEVRFQLWDASECRALEATAPVAFAGDEVVGSPTSPVRIGVQGAVLQTVALQQGTTWISFGVEAVDMSAKTLLKEIKPKEGDLVTGQTGFSQYSVGNGWVGTLDTLRAGVLYKVRVAEAQPFPLVGQPVRGSDRPLAVTDGWNWIGYLPGNPLPPATALASLQLAGGDLLRNQTAFAQFDAGSWQGSLTTMEPGAGYMLKLGTPGTLTYPDAAGTRVEIETVVSAGPPDWRVDAADFGAAMTVTGTILLDGIPTTNGNTILAAFVDGEVRGVAMPSFVGNRWVYFLPIFADAAGAQVSFKVYDSATGTIRPLAQTVTFAEDTGRGTLREPFALTTGTATSAGADGLPAAFALEANAPNPFGEATAIRYALPAAAPVTLEVYDLLGRRVTTLVDEQQPAGRYTVTVRAESLAAGVYVYRLRAGQFVQSHRMVVVR